tara:strand:- start:2 stop:142 length:141 start_codon:yes stop_codon:yes gene_type:complete
MQRYKNIYIEERPKEFVPTFQIQYNLNKIKNIEKPKINDKIQKSIS